MPRTSRHLSRRGLFSSLFVLLALRTLSAHASDTADEAQFQFELGADAYQKSDFRSALEHFLASNRLSPNQNVMFNIARVFQKLGRYPEAYRYYQSAYAKTVDEEEKTRLRASLAELEKSVAVLEVETFPAGATVYVDRLELGSRGEAPLSLGLSAGKYVVLTELPGYKSARVEVPETAPGEKRKIEIRLEPLLGTIVVSGKAYEKSRVSLEGAESCEAPCELSVSPGQHTLTLERPGYRRVDQTIFVEAERRLVVSPLLVESTGNLLVEADETGALIEIDGRPHGFSPSLLKVPVGSHEVVISYPGATAAKRTVEIVEDKTSKLKVELLRREEVTVASRRLERAVDAPSSVTIIPSEELRLFAYPTVAEALRGTPGVYQSDDRAYPTLAIRGIGRLGSYGNRVLVLTDDHPMNDDWIGSSYVGFDGRTDLADVERIEVVRGPGSALYGTNAMAGVVNVVTRKVGEKSSTEAGVSAMFDGVGRVRARQDVRLSKDASLFVSAGLGRSEGTRFFLDSGTRGAPFVTEPSSDGFEAGTAQARFTYKKFRLAAFGHTHEKHVPTGSFETILADPRMRQRDSRAYVEARFEPEISEELSSLTRAHLNYYGYDGYFPRPAAEGGVERDQYDGQWAGVEQRFQYTPAKIVSFTLGGEAQYHYRTNQTAEDESGSFLADDHKLGVFAGYGIVDVFLSRVHLTGGARFDSYSTFGSSVNPRLAAVVSSYEGGTTKFIFGKAFRAPSLYELYYNDGGYTQIASPNLRPEELWSAEIEHNHRFSKNWNGTLGVFWTRVDSLVTPTGNGTTVSPIRLVNSDAPLASAGGEARLRREWAQGAMLEVNYSLATTEFLASGNFGDQLAWQKSSDHQGVANVPNHMASFKGAIPILGRALTLGAKLTAESGRLTREETPSDGGQLRTKPFVYADLSLLGTEPLSGLRYNFGVYNAFDWHVDLPVSSEFPMRTFAQRGRTFFVDVNYQF